MGSSAIPEGEASSWSIDSRTIAPGAVFFALRGERLDGHAYVPDVLSRGAMAAVIDADLGEDTRFIRVDDTLRALQSLAAWARVRWAGTVVAVTGSAGKTSTKDIVASLLGSAMPTGRTTGNFNNHIGLPLSLLRIPDEARVAVLEIGMNHAGEIRDLASIARPDIGIVTNAGYAHVENFPDGIDGVALAKRELIEALPAKGTAILNCDDERVRRFREIHNGPVLCYGLSPEADVHAENLEMTEGVTTFTVDEIAFETSLPGHHAVRNILAGIAAARVFGIDPASLVEYVRALQPGKMRGERMLHAGVRIINDCYNSNPEALHSMLEVLRDMPAQRRVAVLGEMLELGHWSEPLHREAGKYAAQCGVSVLAGIRGAAEALVEGAVEAGLRKDAAYFFENPADAGTWLRDQARQGDAILFKGSRGTHVELALEKFLE